MRRFLSFWTIVLCAGQIHAAANPPTLTMHIFDEAVPAATVAHAKPQTASDPVQNMVVFDDAPKPAPARSVTPRDFTFSYDVATGYQQEQLSWSTASPTGTPNPITQVAWNDIALTRLQTAFDITTPSGFSFKGMGNYGWVVDGSGQEQAYGNPAQTSPSNQGYSWSGSLATGYQFKLTRRNNALSVTPLVGYAWQKQKNTLGQAQQNRYTSDWEGPWLGMNIALSLFDRHQLFSGFQYHWADYYATADWQSASGLQRSTSFIHNATATGIFATAGYRYKVSEQWGMKLAVDYQKWQTDSGNERLFLPNGTAVNSSLNSVRRESMGVNLGVNFSF